MQNAGVTKEVGKRAIVLLRAPEGHPVRTAPGRKTVVQAIPSEHRSTLAPPMEQPTLMPAKCFVRDLANGQEVNPSSSCARNRGARGETASRSSSFSSAMSRGSVEAVVWTRRGARARVRGGSVVRVLGRFSVDDRYGAAITVQRMRARTSRSTTWPTSPRAAHPYAQMAADLHALVQTIQRPHLRSALRMIDPACDSGRIYHEAPAANITTSLPPRTARALPVGGSGSQRSGRHLPASTATSPSAARACTTSARRGLRSPTAPSSSPTPASCSARSRWATTRCGVRSSASTAFPPADARPAAHILIHHGRLEHGAGSPCTREATLCTSSTTSAAISAASTESRRRSPKGTAGRTSTAVCRRRPTSGTRERVDGREAA